jgi:hypothetical protein
MGHRNGRAETLFEAVRRAGDFFKDDFWRGPKLALDTIFEVGLVGDQRRWRVRASRIVASPRRPL